MNVHHVIFAIFFAVVAISAVLADSSQQNDVVTYEEVKALKDNTSVYLFDVRRPSELVETGFIPGAINIPIDTLEDTLKNLSSEEFSKKFNRPKPDLDTILVFYCTTGIRSAKAQKIALDLGYINAKNYLGSWRDWEAKLKAEKAT
ncbi:hypothetical protein AMK59_7741 [Oryctes borbonicus]|uniref:Rhodanese domain-containing protein n=1 Tax=Oryctes borbonicus TaxID=1629725 RepID=A0A0T6B033_9SCAR|nr:hypothetical protein AMK59_7741 [Oryctes borbonicus]